MRFNAEQHPEACFECFKSGWLLPSNLALEVSFQYERSHYFFLDLLYIGCGNSRCNQLKNFNFSTHYM
jgi:hypothetical protein